MRKLIILMSLCAIVFAACDDKDSGKGTVTAAATSRVKSVTGHNSHWGDYTMTMHYLKNELDTIVVHNPAGERIGRVFFSKSEDASTFSVYDYIPEVSPEELAELVAEYGEEGAKEHYEMVSRTYMTVKIEYWQGAISAQTFTLFRPADNEPGEEYDNNYVRDSRRRDVFEYDLSGRMISYRTLVDVYDHEQGDNYFDRSIRKTEVVSNGEHVTAMNLYDADGDVETTESYVQVGTYNFNYTSGQLMSVSGDGFERSYTYSGSLPASIATNGRTVSYQYNTDGLVTRITAPDGEYAEITYEAGDGNVELMAPIYETLFGIPVVI